MKRSARAVLLTLVGALLMTPGSASADVAAWGSNEDGALCDGHSPTEQLLSSVPVAGAPQKIAAVAGGEDFVVLLEEDGSVWTCGANNEGQLGDGSEGGSSETPVEVQLPGTSPAVQVAASDHTGYARLADGQVYSWGGPLETRGWNLRSFRNPSEPASVQYLEGAGEAIEASSIAAGPNTAAAVLTNHHAVVWGKQEYAQACHRAEHKWETPVEVEGAGEAAQVSLGYEDTYVLLQSGEVKACTQGKLTKLELPSTRGIAAGWFSLLSLDGSGNVYLSEEGHAPREEVGPGVEAIAAGENTYMALEAGKVYTYGDNARGMRGIGVPEGEDTEAELHWTEVSALSEAVSVVGIGRFDEYVGGGGAPAPKVVNLAGRHLSGSSLTLKKVNQSFELPPGQVAGWAAQWGQLSATFSTGPFTARFDLFGVVPVTLGLEVSNGVLDGSIDESVIARGTETLGINSVSMLGLAIRTSCQASVTLEGSGPDELQRLVVSGQAVIGSFLCHGGLLGSAAGPLVLTPLLSGPGNPFTLVAGA